MKKIDVLKRKKTKANVGRKALPVEEKKVTVSFYVKSKYVEKLREFVKPFLESHKQ